MIIVGLFLSVLGIVFLCWLLFTLAVYALRFYAGLTAAFAAYHTGAGLIGAAIVGVSAGAVTLVAGQIAFALVKSPILRGMIAMIFAAPAAVAGHHPTLGLGLVQIGVSSLIWCEIFAVIGAICVGGTEFIRMTAIADSPATGQVLSSNSSQPMLSPTTTDHGNPTPPSLGAHSGAIVVRPPQAR
jgi:hypothetical protein